MKKTLIASVLLLSCFVLVGCGKTETNTDSSTPSASSSGQAMFAVADCNNYADIMKCVIAKSPASTQAQAQKSFDDVLVLWKTLTPDQLTKACESNMKAIDQQKSMIESMGCTIK